MFYCEPFISVILNEVKNLSLLSHEILRFAQDDKKSHLASLLAMTATP
jgi:hypothetical protein